MSASSSNGSGSVTHASIRPLERSDIAHVKAVIDATGMFPSAMLDDMIGDSLTAEASDEHWLTCDMQGPVAVAYYAPEQMTEGTWNLYLIAVHPDQQGKGIGARLMQYIEDQLANRGQRVLLVETSGLATYARTRQFYRRIGYDEEARIREFYAAGDDKVIFRKALCA